MTDASSQRTITLDTDLVSRLGYVIIVANETNVDAGVVVQGEAGELISGAASVTLDAYEVVALYATGTAWMRWPNFA